MSKSYPHTARTERVRDKKRTPEAKATTIARKRARDAKYNTGKER